MMSWQRPESVPFPNVWERFEGNVSTNGKRFRYRIQDVTDELIEPVINHMVKYFLIREACLSHDGFAEDTEAISEITAMWRQKLSHRLSLVAITERDGNEPERIAGCNILAATQKDDPKLSGEGLAMKRLIALFGTFYEKENVFEKFNVEVFLNGFGLSVAPQYQGDNIGYYLIKCRTPLCLAVGIPLTMTVFSSPAAIRQAKRAGFHVLDERSSDSFKIHDEIAYPRFRAFPLILAAKVILAS